MHIWDCVLTNSDQLLINTLTWQRSSGPDSPLELWILRRLEAPGPAAPDACEELPASRGTTGANRNCSLSFCEGFFLASPLGKQQRKRIASRTLGRASYILSRALTGGMLSRSGDRRKPGSIQPDLGLGSGLWVLLNELSFWS